MGDRHQLGARRKQLLEFLDEEIALLIDRRPLDHRALALAQEMPRHHVGMVLHDREHDLIAGLDAFAAEGIGDEIYGLGGVAGEDDFFLAGGVEKSAHLLARVLVRLGRGIGEVMQSAMHIGVFGGVGVRDALQHRATVAGLHIHQHVATKNHVKRTFDPPWNGSQVYCAKLHKATNGRSDAPMPGDAGLA